VLGICFVTNKPGVEGYISVSIFPQERTGAWDDDTLEIAFENLVADEFEEGVRIRAFSTGWGFPPL